MKIANTIRNTYFNLKEINERLSNEVRSWLEGQVQDNGWFFVHRIKKLESYALKAETGRVSNPARMEDFFACTIIVSTASEISEAESLLLTRYTVTERRPSEDQITNKRSSNFLFDDLRLYLMLGPSATGRNTDLESLVFEVQVKTILQHAWSIATHDLIYKTDSVSWSKERIAFQVKAMLEHTELAIAEAGRLADSSTIAKTDDATKKTLEIINSVRAFWPTERLPKDTRRLAQIIQSVLSFCNIDPSQLVNILQEEQKRSRTLPMNLSPYAFFIQALANKPEVNLEKAISRSSNRTRILVHDDMELPDWMKNPHKKIIRI